jgi:hypothetical protein
MDRIVTAAALVLAGGIAGCGESYTYLTYSHSIFQGSASGTIDRMVQADPNKIPDVFVKTPQGATFPLKALPEDVVAKLPGVRLTKNLGVERYEIDATALEYKNGTLFQATFGAGPLLIGAKEAGPFRQLPMTAAEVRNLFGPPERSGRASKSAVDFKSR